jgi:hypothetical protein
MKNILLTSLLLLLTACSPSSPHERLTKVLQTTRSWTATALMVGESWQQGSIPDQYARQTLTKSQQEIGKEAKTLNTPPALLQQLQQTIQLIGTNVEQNNQSAIAISLRKLSTEQQQLNTLAKSQGAQP